MSGAVLDNFNAQMEAAGKLREERAGSRKEEVAVEENDRPLSLRERVFQARRSQDLAEQAKSKAVGKIAEPVQMATGAFLKKMWMLAPETFGLTGLYANIHVFMKWIFGDKLFCKLGREWAPKQTQAMGKEAVEQFGAKVGLAEAALLLILDLIVLFLILGIIALIVMMVDFMQGSIIDKVTMVVKGITTIGWEGLSALYYLFHP